MNNYLKNLALIIFLFPTVISINAQEYSVARIWNEMVLNAIRNDFARPTVHARNLFHTSIAMYDAFAAYDGQNETYFLGKELAGFECPFEGVPVPDDINEAREVAISYAVYRILEHRFKDAPRKEDIFHDTDLVFSALGLDRFYTDTDYINGNPAALGNYIAEQIIAFGLLDGSNEEGGYKNLYYSPVNPPLNPYIPFFRPQVSFGNPLPVDPNRWQPLDIPDFVDQAGNLIEGGSLPFLSAEWGRVVPFALEEQDLSIKTRDNADYWIYHDPGPPPYLDLLEGAGGTEDFIWGFSLVAHWRSHTIADSTKIWDISPNSLGNLEEIPENLEDLKAYYNFEEGGDYSRGYDVNPITGLPYEPQDVLLSDYSRVVAEYWADGLNSETPPGHWFTILNYVNDREELEKKFGGDGPLLSDLEWDVKAYMCMAGAMHDSAISAWSVKGYYDYIRPVSAVRYLIYNGQSSDPMMPSYSKSGIRLVPGSIEQILDGDPQLFPDSSNYGRIKYFSNLFEDTKFFANGDLWFPYQDINFVTPPFAGYVSGHSTYSRAAAEVLTKLTGSKYFPGGLGEVHFEANRFLEFGEPGPSKDISLQWATYYDAANQSGLSRIWGGIHPPFDDIPGRLIGKKVGVKAYEEASSLFGDPLSRVQEDLSQPIFVFGPNPIGINQKLKIKALDSELCQSFVLTDNTGKLISEFELQQQSGEIIIDLFGLGLESGIYQLSCPTKLYTQRLIVVN